MRMPPTSWFMISSEVILVPVGLPLQKYLRRFLRDQSHTLEMLNTTQHTMSKEADDTYPIISDSLATTRRLS